MVEKYKGIKLIGQIDFHDIQVGVYYNSYLDEFTTEICSWQSRSPKSFYQGPAFLSYLDNKISYPKDAVIPKQTDRDREMLPKFIVTGKNEIDEEFKTAVKTYLYLEYTRRNQIYQDQG